MTNVLLDIESGSRVGCMAKIGNSPRIKGLANSALLNHFSRDRGEAFRYCTQTSLSLLLEI